MLSSIPIGAEGLAKLNPCTFDRILHLDVFPPVTLHPVYKNVVGSVPSTVQMDLYENLCFYGATCMRLTGPFLYGSS